MQPIVHLAVGYLCVAAYRRWTRADPPGGAAAGAAVFAAALPDLLDKPPWLLGVVPVGRTLGHSLLFAVPFGLAVWLRSADFEREPLGTAFVVGLFSHVATDVPWHVVAGDYHELRFLLWPITRTPPYTGTKVLGTVGGLELTTLWLEAAILIAGVVVWWRDGRPGLDGLREAVAE